MVLYIVCFDVSEPVEQQTEQISYWLEFLNSALPLPTTVSDTKWSIILAGITIATSTLCCQ